MVSYNWASANFIIMRSVASECSADPWISTIQQFDYHSVLSCDGDLSVQVGLLSILQENPHLAGDAHVTKGTTQE